MSANPPKIVNDEELVERIKSGDKDSLDALVKAYLPRVHNRVRSLVPKPDVDDVTQDIFIGLIDSIDDFQGRSAFTTWFHRITMNKVADYHRKASRQREELFEKEDYKVFNPWEEMDERLVAEEILKGIPDKYKEVLLLKLVEGLSFAEIAKELGLTYEATRSRYRRAITMVRKRIRSSHRKIRSTK